MSRPPTEAAGRGDPLDLVDRTELTYEERLTRLQDWKSELAADGADSARLDELDSAILALENGAELQGDTSEEVPGGRSFDDAPK